MLPGMDRALIESKLNYTFRRPEWLRQALVHPSAGQGRAEQLAYERLEYLGDAVLELVVSTELFRRYPEADEGVLTKMRASIVSRKHLAQLAAQLDWGAQLTMSPQLEKSGGRAASSILANTFESIVGAVMMDAGYEPACAVARRLLAGSWPQAEAWVAANPKGELQEVLQALDGVGPTYRVVQVQEAPPAFEAVALWGVREIGSGCGSSKHKAEVAAAADALARRVFATPDQGA